MTDSVKFFKTPTDFRKWLQQHHDSLDEQWVGFYKKASGKPSIDWPESVDEALCVGWIDGLRKSIDEESYRIRFTPRRPGSKWSSRNIGRVEVLIEEGRMRPSGLRAFENRTEEKSGTYSYEQIRESKLGAEYEKSFKQSTAAWKYFQKQPPWYRSTATFWVVSAKKEETRLRRLGQLIEHSEAGRPIPQLDRGK